MRTYLRSLFVTLWTALAVSAAPLQQHPPVAPADAATPLLVWDVAPDLRDKLPRNFRTTDDAIENKEGVAQTLAGLKALRASGSAEFTAKGLGLMLKRLPGTVTIIDLRQEDHVFVNGLPVSWMATNNWANVGKTREEIIAGEQARVAGLKLGSVVDINDDSVKKKNNSTAKPEPVTIGDAKTEEETVLASGAHYLRIPVTDHARPLDEAVDRFVLSVRSLPEGGWVHFHCRAGRGRTTTFMALYDMLRNASAVSLDDIVNRQSLLAGDYDLLGKEKDSGASWKSGVSADRADFVRAFYDYAKSNPGGRPLLWSEWLKQREGTSVSH